VISPVLRDYPARRSIRLQDYDYADEGAYFVTICTYGRACLFGEIVNGEMRLSRVGEVVLNEWLQTAIVRPNVELDAFVIMPNHVHGIIVITDRAGNNVGAQRAAPLQQPLTPNSSNRDKRPHVTPGSLGAIVRSFKSASTRSVNILRDTPAMPLWQRNYYEHVIRDEGDLNRIRLYIECNPQMWDTDEENPARLRLHRI
jgi:REP element-mobilizing transposase RayT